jgi:hypothetical protein
VAAMWRRLLARTPAQDVGALLGKAGTSDVVDAHVVHVADKLRATVLTGDDDDLSRLADHAPRTIASTACRP